MNSDIFEISKLFKALIFVTFSSTMIFGPDLKSLMLKSRNKKRELVTTGLILNFSFGNFIDLDLMIFIFDG